MYRYAVLLLTAFVCSALAGTVPDGRIVGGRDADINQFPYQISMRYNGNHRCGGSIMNENIILSAAHCVNTLSGPEGLTIVAGNTLLSDKSVALPVLKFIVHPNYTSNDNDVAILVLRGLLVFGSGIQPITLLRERPPVGSVLTVTGWGVLAEGDKVVPNHLQQVEVDLIANTVCSRSYPFLITKQMVCTTVEGGGKDACQGDSGGPLVFENPQTKKYEQVGVVSWGIGCARRLFPGVCASVPDLYDWIVKTTDENTIGWA